MVGGLLSKSNERVLININNSGNGKSVKFPWVSMEKSFSISNPTRLVQVTKVVLVNNIRG